MENTPQGAIVPQQVCVIQMQSRRRNWRKLAAGDADGKYGVLDTPARTIQLRKIS
jgi:hypothetical protein